jgi:hypothetical protein
VEQVETSVRPDYPLTLLCPGLPQRQQIFKSLDFPLNQNFL